MKIIARDFTLSMNVPDEVDINDCEIVITETAAGYVDKESGKTVSQPNVGVNIYSSEYYEP